MTLEQVLELILPPSFHTFCPTKIVNCTKCLFYQLNNSTSLFFSPTKTLLRKVRDEWQKLETEFRELLQDCYNSYPRIPSFTTADYPELPTQGLWAAERTMIPLLPPPTEQPCSLRPNPCPPWPPMALQKSFELPAFSKAGSYSLAKQGIGSGDKRRDMPATWGKPHHLELGELLTVHTATGRRHIGQTRGPRCRPITAEQRWPRSRLTKNIAWGESLGKLSARLDFYVVRIHLETCHPAVLTPLACPPGTGPDAWIKDCQNLKGLFTPISSSQKGNNFLVVPLPGRWKKSRQVRPNTSHSSAYLPPSTLEQRGLCSEFGTTKKRQRKNGISGRVGGYE